MELTRTAHESHAGPGGFGSDPFAASDTGAPVTVCHGPYSESLPVGGMSVGEVRARFADRFDLHPMSQAFVDGQEVGDDTRVTSGQLLSFMRRAGEKGRGTGRCLFSPVGAVHSSPRRKSWVS